MMVACGLGFQVLAECGLATSRFQPDSHGSFPAFTRTLARLMSPPLCSMPGWVKVAGAACALPWVSAAAVPPTAPAAARPPAARSRPRRLISGVFLRIIAMIPFRGWDLVDRSGAGLLD